MNDFLIEIEIDKQNTLITNVILLGRSINHDCWNTNISDYKKIQFSNTIEEIKIKLKEYLLSIDKSQKYIDNKINNLKYSINVK